jgi:hypothetical protein
LLKEYITAENGLCSPLINDVKKIRTNRKNTLYCWAASMLKKPGVNHAMTTTTGANIAINAIIENRDVLNIFVAPVTSDRCI